MFKQFKKNTLYCFSPEVMLATFVIEVVLAIYAFVRYRTTFFGRIVGVMLLLLGIFQAAEYQICSGLSDVVWARIGIIATSLLPILGLHLILMMGGSTRVMKWLYTGIGIMVLYFLFSPIAITGAVCGGNYVLFESEHFFYWLYGIYYLGFLLFGMWKARRQALRMKPEEKEKKSALYWMIAGYLSFLLPMGFVFLLYESTMVGVVSIMCGFAVIFAVILATRILPLYHRQTNPKFK